MKSLKTPKRLSTRHICPCRQIWLMGSAGRRKYVRRQFDSRRISAWRAAQSRMRPANRNAPSMISSSPWIGSPRRQQTAHDCQFLLTARAENFLHGRPDLDDTIRRLQAFAEAGADILYAPGLTSLEAIRDVCASVSKPVNVLMGLKGATFSVEELTAVGVKRISVGGAFARAALGAFVRAAREVKENGTFTFAADALPHAEATGYMADVKR